MSSARRALCSSWIDRGERRGRFALWESIRVSISVFVIIFYDPDLCCPQCSRCLWRVGLRGFAAIVQLQPAPFLRPRT